jgi:integrase
MELDSFIKVRSASEVKDVINGVIDLTLGIATQGYFDPGTSSEQVDTACRVNADFHDLAARHGGIAVLDEVEEARLRGDGRDSTHIDHLRRLVRSVGGGLVISDANLQIRLKHIGARPLVETTAQDRLLMHRAISEGQRRAAFFNDPRVAASGDPLHYLLTQGGTLSAASQTTSGTPEAQSSSRTSAEAAAPAELRSVPSPMLGGLIDSIIDNIVRGDNWTEGVGEDARRLMKQFVWTIGDKPCLEYSQADVARFRDALWSMPKTVRVKSIWHVPYEQAVRAFPKLTDANKRSNKTLNKDLSYMSTFAKEMVAVGHWPENFINPLGLAVTVTRQQKSSGRIPWKPAHLEAMFRSPIYRGNAGSQRRLKDGSVVYHDAAYWMPLLGAYQLGRRDEHAGHNTTDFIFGQGTPHMLIYPNEVRELKSEGSARFLPIHPRLLELGLREFVEAAASRGEKLLFPELWLNAVKKGGDQYYGVSWRKLVDWLRDQPGIMVPRTSTGKEADFHSIRSTGLSQLDRADINQNIVADIAGHSREGTTARSYQKLLESGGLEDVLQERLKVLMRLPDYAADLQRHPLKVMHVKVRTR